MCVIRRCWNHCQFIAHCTFTQPILPCTARFIKPYRDPVKHALDLGKVLWNGRYTMARLSHQICFHFTAECSQTTHAGGCKKIILGKTTFFNNFFRHISPLSLFMCLVDIFWTILSMSILTVKYGKCHKNCKNCFFKSF